MENKKISPVTEKSEQATAYVADERTNLGFTPQCSATTDSNSSIHSNNGGYFLELAQSYCAVQLESCFQNMAIDPDLMVEIKNKLKLAPNQELYIHEMIKRTIESAKDGFMNGSVKVDVLEVSRFPALGQIAEFLGQSEEEQSKHPNKKEFCEPWKGLLRPLGRNRDILLTKCVKDLRFDDGIIMYPKGTLIGTIAKDPFPKVPEPYAYRELLDPDNYSAPHDVLDFVNKKLHEAYPQFNLWCVALDLDNLSIFDLDKLPHMKRY